jgi:hypothetical protein
MKFDHDTSIRRLERLSRLREYDVASGEPDPRGWTVVDRQGHKIGEVKDLVVDIERMTASYLDVELDAKLFVLRGASGQGRASRAGMQFRRRT